jgi:hypothetical protein
MPHQHKPQKEGTIGTDGAFLVHQKNARPGLLMGVDTTLAQNMKSIEIRGRVLLGALRAEFPNIRGLLFSHIPYHVGSPGGRGFISEEEFAVFQKLQCWSIDSEEGLCFGKNRDRVIEIAANVGMGRIGFGQEPTFANLESLSRNSPEGQMQDGERRLYKHDNAPSVTFAAIYISEPKK